MTSFNKTFTEARKAGKKTFIWNGRSYSTKYKTEIPVPQTVHASGKPVKYVDSNTGEVITNLPEIIVNSPRLKIDPKYKGTTFGLLQDQNNPRIWQDYNTGLYYITDNYNNIIGTTLSKELAEKGNFQHYYGLQLSDATRAAAITEAADEVNASVSRWDPRKILTSEKLENDIRNARNQFANVVNGFVNVPNHVVLGPVAAATRNDYDLSDWVKGLNPYNGIQNQIIGLGDVINPANENWRMALNLINPTSVAMTGARAYANFNPAQHRLVPAGRTQPSYIRLNVPTRASRAIYQSGAKGASQGSPVRNANQSMGYRQYSHPASTFNNDFRGTTRLVTFTLPGETTYTFTPATFNISPLPTFYYRSPIVKTQFAELPKPHKGFVEAPFVDRWHKQWILTGEMPKTSATSWKPTDRETVAMDNNSYWRGLLGTDYVRTTDSQLGNTNYEPNGYNVKSKY